MLLLAGGLVLAWGLFFWGMEAATRRPGSADGQWQVVAFAAISLALGIAIACHVVRGIEAITGFRTVLSGRGMVFLFALCTAFSTALVPAYVAVLAVRFFKARRIALRR